MAVTRLFQILLLVCVCLPALAPAADTGDDWLPKARETTTGIREKLDRVRIATEISPEMLSQWGDDLAPIGNQTRKCVHDTTDKLNKLQDDLKGLKTASGTADAALAQARRDLQRRIDEASTRIASCQALLVEAGSLADRVNAIQTEQRNRYLFARGKPVWVSLTQVLLAPLDWHRNLMAFVRSHVRIQTLSVIGWLIVAGSAGIGWLLGGWLRQVLARRAVSVRGGPTTAAFLAALYACAAKGMRTIMLLAAAGFAAAVVMRIEPGNLPLVVVLISCILLYLATSLMTRVLLDPCPPATHYLKLDPRFSAGLNRHLRSVWLVGFAVVFLLISGLYSAFDSDQQKILRAAVVAVVVVNLIWLGIVLSRASGVRVKGAIRALAVLVLAAALAAEILGYSNLSVYLLKALLGSIVLAVALWFGNMLVRDFFDGVEQGRHGWEKRLRVSLDLKDAEPVPGLIWLRLLTVLVLWVLFAAGMLDLWGYSDTTWLWVQGILGNGFEIGAVHIVPLQFATGLMIFALFLTGMRWFNREVLPGWVRRTHLDRGAREAVVTLSGYVGILVAALIGLSLAGFSLQNLAIVAGALSVGIGFGLQNIVNNFVSGIILLFERPIRTGDWIVAGDVQGFVRRISIRSTLIETFDRADVIVPNSALISNNVTNWMLRDPWGRVTVPVGVAYGSDVDKVTEVLLSAAGEHPLVMADGKHVNPPQVLFTGFGDSSLNFELRCFIREVDKRLVTLSDLNYAIERKLREAGIEIPFPQRDLHLRSVDPQLGWPGGRPQGSSKDD